MMVLPTGSMKHASHGWAVLMANRAASLKEVAIVK